jgi:hypothetical protein
MISADTMMYCLGVFLILCAVYLVGVLILKKSIWNYPPVVSIYVFWTIYFIFGGIIFIEHIEFTYTMGILTIVALVIWGFITFRLPARKEEIDVYNKHQ